VGVVIFGIVIVGVVVFGVFIVLVVVALVVTAVVEVWWWLWLLFQLSLEGGGNLWHIRNIDTSRNSV